MEQLWQYVDIFIKLLIGISYSVLVMKISGKANLAPMGPLDQIQNYILGGIIGGVLYNPDISTFQFFIVMTIWAVISVSLNLLRKHNIRVKHLIDGGTIRVITHGKIDRKGVEKARLPIGDLYLKLRLQGVQNIEDIVYGQIESNGSLVLTTLEEENKYPLLLVVDKVIYRDNLEKINKDEAWLLEYVQKLGYSSFDDLASVEYFDADFRVIPWS